MMYYAQAIADQDTSVYLATCCTSSITKHDFEELFPNVFVLKTKKTTQSFFGTIAYIKNYYRFSKTVSDNSAYLFYPSPLVYLEIIALFYLKFLKKCSVFYELNEVRKHTATFHQAVSFRRPLYSIKKMVYKTVFNVLELALKSYDGLICISTAIEKYGQKFNKRTVRVPILTNPYFEKSVSSNTYAKDKSFNIGFSGSIHPSKENLNAFFEVLGRLKENEIEFTLNLCGPIKDTHKVLLLDNHASALGIKENINFYGKLNAQELSTFLDQQELLVIPRGYTLQNNFGFSTKLSDYLDHAKPILVTDVSDNKLFIEDGINGFIVPPNNNDLMYEKLIYIITNYKELNESIKVNARETSLKSFYYKNYHKPLNQFLFKTAS